jgi:hypothetical protein
VASTEGRTPSPREAQAALDAAASQAGRVRRSDRQFAPILLWLAAMDLAIGVVVGFFPRGGSPVASIGVAVIGIGGLAGILWLFWRIRAWSTVGTIRIAWAFGIFSIWNAVVVGVSQASARWFLSAPGFRFTATAAVACLPLLIGARLLGQKQA